MEQEEMARELDRSYHEGFQEGVKQGRRRQQGLAVEWLEKHVLKERMLSNPVVIMGIEVWHAFKNLPIE